MFCAQCGARVSEDAERCDLCGTAVEKQEPVEASDVVQTRESEDHFAADNDNADNGRGVEQPSGRLAATACPACGRLNSPDATFCDQCATPLEKEGAAVTRPAKPPLPGPKSSAGRKKKEKKKEKKKKEPAPEKSDVEEQVKSRVGALIVAGIILVAALYGITVLSKSRSAPEPSAAATTSDQQRQETPSTSSYLPEDDELAGQTAAIRSEIAETDDPARKLALRTDLVELYARSGRLDLAGREQDAIAGSQNTAADWTLAGNLHFDWMEQQSGTERVNAAQRAVASYQKALEIEPDNLDVRTDLGVAYLNDPASPMLAIQETNAVLEQNPDHVQANFNKAVMLLQIGRQAEAVEHFEKVLTLTEPGTPPHDRANSVLEQIQQTSD